jgi:hypothetical protein|eukprot:COSAG01_NODE_1402_length_10450_cov_14.099411_4_plen_229_part_00
MQLELWEVGEGAALPEMPPPPPQSKEAVGVGHEEESQGAGSAAEVSEGGRLGPYDGMIWVVDAATLHADDDDNDVGDGDGDWDAGGTRSQGYLQGSDLDHRTPLASSVDALWAEDGAALQHALLSGHEHGQQPLGAHVPLLVMAHKIDARRPGLARAARWIQMDSRDLEQRLGLADAEPERVWRVVGTSAVLGAEIGAGADWLCECMAQPAAAARRWFGAALAATRCV